MLTPETGSRKLTSAKGPLSHAAAVVPEGLFVKVAGGFVTVTQFALNSIPKPGMMKPSKGWMGWMWAPPLKGGVGKGKGLPAVSGVARYDDDLVRAVRRVRHDHLSLHHQHFCFFFLRPGGKRQDCA